jgi:4-hydroxy-4-methyl-2-oxoglutarate aldolase
MATSVSDQASAIDFLRSVDSATISNAIERLDVRPRSEGFASAKLRCFFPELGRMVGYAVTAHAETLTEPDSEPRRSMELYEAVMNSAKPAVVVIQEIGPRPEFATHCGEVMTTIFKRLGAVGLISDSGVRDIPEVRALRFHYFAPGAVASHGYFRIVRVGVPVQVLGLPIRPNDLLHGDENGLVVVPKETLDRLPAAVEAVRTAEGKLLEFVRGPKFNLEGLRELWKY